MESSSKDSIHYYVRGLFRGITETPEIAEQREELEVHLNDRVADGISRGLSHEAAFCSVVASLGDLNELIETMTGAGKKVYARKADWLMMAGGIAYGTLYMIAVGIWFAFRDFGWTAVYIAIPGWLGYVVPALIKLAAYRAMPGATAVVPVNRKAQVRSAFIGWAAISAACWVVNILFINTTLFLNVVWAWMPTLGLLTWPLMEAGYSWMIVNLKSLEPSSEAR